MSSIENKSVIDQLLDPVAKCFTADVARQISSLRADTKTQADIDALAAKANEGELNADESAKYLSYVEMIDIIGILQAKSRAILQQQDA